MATVPDDSIATVQQEPLPGRAYPRFADQASPEDFGAGLARVGERLESLHRRTAALDRAVILLNDIVEVLAGPHLHVFPLWILPW